MRSLLVGGIGAVALAAGASASAQDNSSASGGTNAAVGAPQLRDFQLPGSRQVVAQPQPSQPPVANVAPPSPVAVAPGQVRPAPNRPAAEPRRQAQAPAQAPQPAPGAIPAPAANGPAAAVAPVQTPVAGPAQPAAEAPAPAPSTASAIPWLYVLPAAGLLLILGFAFLRSRRRREEIAEAVAVAAPRAAPAPAQGPKPQPVPRPWLELELKAERAQSTLTEAVVDFELSIINSGKAPARNLRIDVKMFNTSQEQDQEIGAFFRSAGRESTKCQLPGIAPDTTGVIRGSVAMPRDDMKALLLKDRYLFVPVIAVNALYDYGDGQTGQTSKSYVVGRELETPSEKMGAFRVDQGPRVWRTVGQRQHKLARRV